MNIVIIILEVLNLKMQCIIIYVSVVGPEGWPIISAYTKNFSQVELIVDKTYDNPLLLLPGSIDKDGNWLCILKNQFNGNHYCCKYSQEGKLIYQSAEMEEYIVDFDESFIIIIDDTDYNNKILKVFDINKNQMTEIADYTGSKRDLGMWDCIVQRNRENSDIIEFYWHENGRRCTGC